MNEGCPEGVRDACGGDGQRSGAARPVPAPIAGRHGVRRIGPQVVTRRGSRRAPRCCGAVGAVLWPRCGAEHRSPGSCCGCLIGPPRRGTSGPVCCCEAQLRRDAAFDGTEALGPLIGGADGPRWP
ncbi:hypothetical protein NDU88_006729 [Pleurodeles waltl]|uniref:Uncharacterized protein n=1 Tax=Pleurodeles waltl TaxID=8319 RepID=A0AAV7ME28_PLEWA|nr:hypothetical protein NDU88_006729 [Pleurodeles waltl]